MTRATPLPPDERRAALIAATEPLLEEFGREVSTRQIAQAASVAEGICREVSTRQIAQAASVAEGTIFRAFTTKDALIDAVLEEVFDVQRTCDELHRIDLGLDLEARMIAAVAVLQARLRKVFALFHSMRLGPRPDQPDFRARQHQDNERLNDGIARLLEPDHDRLRLPPAEAANAFRAITFALTHPIVGNDRHPRPEQIADLVLNGIATEAGC